MLASLTANISGKTLKDPVPESLFLPDYLGEREQVNTEKSIEQQAEEALAFRERLAGMRVKPSN